MLWVVTEPWIKYVAEFNFLLEIYEPIIGPAVVGRGIFLPNVSAFCVVLRFL